MFGQAEEEEVIAEYGTPRAGKKVSVSETDPMKENQAYEFSYRVHTLPVPIPRIDWFREKILRIFMKIQEKHHGLHIFYYRLSNRHFVFQAIGRTLCPGWKEIALSVLVVAASGVFLAAGVVLVLSYIKKILPKPLPSWMPPWWVWGLGALGVIYLIGYVKGKGKQVIVKLEKEKE